jgi:hypothetical protein
VPHLPAPILTTAPSGIEEWVGPGGLGTPPETAPAPRGGVDERPDRHGHAAVPSWRCKAYAYAYIGSGPFGMSGSPE